MSCLVTIPITRGYQVDFSGVEPERIEAIKEAIYSNDYDIDCLSKELGCNVETKCNTQYEAMIDDKKVKLL
jgi:hypothetical protein